MPHTKKSSDDKMLIEKKWGKKKKVGVPRFARAGSGSLAVTADL